MEESLYERNGGTYTQYGEVLLPDLLLPQVKEYHYGKYGRMRQSYLKEHRVSLYYSLLTSGKLAKHLSEIDEECKEKMDTLITAMAKQEGVTETLKANDQMEWVRRMNNIRNRAEEIVLNDIIYV